MTAALEPILNERSLTKAAAPTTERLAQLVLVLRALVAEGLPRVLRYREGDLDQVIDGETSFKRACFDRRLDRDQREWLTQVLSKASYTDALLATAANGRLLEAKVLGEESAGICLAQLTDGITVSLSGAAAFHAPHIEATLYVVEPDGEDHQDAVSVRNATHSAHVDEHRAWLRERLDTGVRSGSEVLAKAAERWPNVRFGPRAERQVRELSGHEAWFGTFLAHLRAFNRGARDWQGGASMPELDWSPETSTTMQEFGSDRRFPLPGGAESREMSKHSKIKSANIRIHFLSPDEVGAPIIIVGYVGPKLATNRYRT